MARATKPTRSAPPAGAARKAGSPAARGGKSVTATARAPAASKAKSPAAKPAPMKPAIASVPKASKEELRAQVEKLERINTTLRAKSRELNKTAKAVAIRIAELEEEVTQLQKKALAEPKRETKPKVSARRKRLSQDPGPDSGSISSRDNGIDPGDAVPPGIAVAEPAPLDEDARAALHNLEEHLGDDRPG